MGCLRCTSEFMFRGGRRRVISFVKSISPRHIQLSSATHRGKVGCGRSVSVILSTSILAPSKPAELVPF